MTGNTALDIFIGLAFVYLLYSLLATVLLEIISTNLSIRASNLRRAVFTMLNDARERPHLLKRIWWFIASLIGRGMHLERGGLAQSFFNSPGIKYLNKNGWVKSSPSSISSDQFASTVIDLLAQEGGANVDANDPRLIAENIKSILKEKVEESKGTNGSISVENSAYRHMLNLYNQAQGDLDKFKEKVEDWYEDMMRMAGEWYKKRMQIWLFVIGIVLAYNFNLNTLHIAKILSLDNKAREQLVEMTGAYIEANKVLPEIPGTDESTNKNGSQLQDQDPAQSPPQDSAPEDSTQADMTPTQVNEPGAENRNEDEVSLKEQKEIYEELNKYYKELQEQAANASYVLGLPKELPTTITVAATYTRAQFDTLKTVPTSYLIDEQRKTVTVFHQPQALKYLNAGKFVEAIESNQDEQHFRFDRSQFFWKYHLWGLLITAFAISLGAPFWFSLLNKVMQLRSTATHKSKQSSTTTDTGSK